MLDLILRVIAMILPVPVIIGLTLAVKLKLGPPVIFQPTRPWFSGARFMLLKSESWPNSVTLTPPLLPSEDGLLNFAPFLRGTSLDELPEGLNVTRGA